MRIFKIGGSVVKSKTDFDNLIQKIHFFNEQKNFQNLFIFSAFAKTSAKLKQMALLATSNEKVLATNLKTEIIDFHKSLLLSKESQFFEYCDLQLNNFIEGLCITNDLTNSVLDKILHFGEYLAIYVIENALDELKVGYYQLDAKSYMTTDSNFGSANPDFSKIKANIANLANNLEQHQLIITQGFIGFDAYLAPTTMGFESSNLTATILADALNVKEINIISDVPALLSADPNYFTKTQLIDYLDFSQARILAKFGLKLLYERMIDIAERKQISIKYSDLSQNAVTIISNSNQAQNKFIVLNLDLLCVSHYKHSIFSFTNGEEVYFFVPKHEIANLICYDYKLITFFGFNKVQILELYRNSAEIVNLSCNENGFAAIVVKEFDVNKVIQKIETILL